MAMSIDPERTDADLGVSPVVSADLAGWVWQLKDDSIVWADRRFDICGYRPSIIAPTMQALLARVHEQDREALGMLLLRAGVEYDEFTCRFRYWLPDGQQRCLLLKRLFQSQPAYEPGRVVGTIHDITDHIDSERALQESTARFFQFGNASSDVLWIRNAESLDLEYLSHAFERLYGSECGSMLAHPTLDSWTSHIVPEDRYKVHEALERVRKGQRVVIEYRIRRGDGALRWMRNTKFPLLDPEGRVVRIGGIGHDCTEEKDQIARTQVLMAELQHRTRNLMAVIRAVADRTLSECDTLEEFGHAYGSRIEAIARVQSLLSSLDDGGKVAFDKLLHEELKAHGAERGRVVLEGPTGVALRSTTLQTFALALHELATNAAKYGALGSETGKLKVCWLVHRWEDGTPALKMTWNEESSEAVARPAERKGSYGRELIERALPYQLKARTSYALTSHGVECTVEVPLPKSASLQPG